MEAANAKNWAVEPQEKKKISDVSNVYRGLNTEMYFLPWISVTLIKDSFCPLATSVQR
jgi:hypothetical protein